MSSVFLNQSDLLSILKKNNFVIGISVFSALTDLIEKQIGSLLVRPLSIGITKQLSSKLQSLKTSWKKLTGKKKINFVNSQKKVKINILSSNCDSKSQCEILTLTSAHTNQSSSQMQADKLLKQQFSD